jgi:hypothetical protein
LTASLAAIVRSVPLGVDGLASMELSATPVLLLLLAVFIMFLMALNPLPRLLFRKSGSALLVETRPGKPTVRSLAADR